MEAEPTELPPMKKRDFTVTELREYDGVKNERILLAVNGKVFDVTNRGKDFYGPSKYSCAILLSLTRYGTYSGASKNCLSLEPCCHICWKLRSSFPETCTIFIRWRLWNICWKGCIKRVGTVSTW